ncbi:hypothetical protein MI353_15090 [Alteromonas sp. MCA-1]|uniref:hypothetical protein n=1 Tax=Alteromonas sp. MCA-1 TaxID=2917731 RepID=UPI001EF9084E|nr:hypothetical protein [Alteromonas sp. MCA-1]MCG7814072.1 hypothetical protein [Alteromonas sp. MCA-1]
MARIVLFMSLLFAAFISNADTFRVFKDHPYTLNNQSLQLTVYFKDQNETIGGSSVWCTSAKYTGTDKYDDNTSISGSMRYTGQCRADWTRTTGSSAGKSVDPVDTLVSCPAGQRPKSYSDRVCVDYDEFQCPANEVIDPVTGNCGCADGNELDQTNSCQPIDDDGDIGDGGDGNDGGDGGDGDGTGSGGGSNNQCSSSEACLNEAEEICSSDGRSVMEYQYRGAGYYTYQCGYQDQDCGDGFSWDRTNQVCLQDLDNDGTPDNQDPEPENPDETGDRDGDGVPDGQDSHPDDPDQWNSNPNSNHNGQNVNPIGQSEFFDDTAIVQALNENTQTSNTTNTKLDELTSQGAITNDLLDGIGESLNGISDTLGEGEPDGKGAGDLSNGVDSALDQFEDMAIDEFNKDIDSNLIVEQGDIPTIETAFGGLELEKCEDISNDLFTLELCSLAPRINPILYWAFACFTVIACFRNVSATLKKENR